MSASDITSDRLLRRLMRACSVREYCSEDIRRKVQRADPEADAEALLEILVAEGYVDDSRYASAFARDKTVIDGWGAAKVRHALAAKRIPQAVADAALAEVDGDARTARMDSVIVRKWEEIRRKRPDEPRQDSLARLLRFCQGRGYSCGEVFDALGRNGL